MIERAITGVEVGFINTKLASRTRIVSCIMKNTMHSRSLARGIRAFSVIHFQQENVYSFYSLGYYPLLEPISDDYLIPALLDLV